MANTFTVFGRNLCEACAEKELDGRNPKSLPEGSLIKNLDPTVCAYCGKDAGNFELPQVADLPVCDECREKLYHRPFPTWVKLSFAAILLLVCVEVARNWRLFQAHLEIPRAHRAMDQGRVADAADLMTRAAEHAPEMPDLAKFASFYRGINCMDEGRYDDAVALFEPLLKSLSGQEAEVVGTYLFSARAGSLIEHKRASEAVKMALDYIRAHPKDKNAPEILQGARIAEAFDGKDYDAFLTLAQEQEASMPDSSFSIAQVASALACKYAVTGDEEYRRKSTAKLDQARAAAKDKKSFLEYEERVLYRLKTREIIDRDEYDRRFRSGSKGGTQ
jgi:hypothetical protein